MVLKYHACFSCACDMRNDKEKCSVPKQFFAPCPGLTLGCLYPQSLVLFVMYTKLCAFRMFLRMKKGKKCVVSFKKLHSTTFLHTDCVVCSMDSRELSFALS